MTLTRSQRGVMPCRRCGGIADWNETFYSVIEWKCRLCGTFVDFTGHETLGHGSVRMVSEDGNCRHDGFLPDGFRPDRIPDWLKEIASDSSERWSYIAYCDEGEVQVLWGSGRLPLWEDRSPLPIFDTARRIYWLIAPFVAHAWGPNIVDNDEIAAYCFETARRANHLGIEIETFDDLERVDTGYVFCGLVHRPSDSPTNPDDDTPTP